MRKKMQRAVGALEGVAPEDVLAFPYLRVSGKKQEKGMSLPAQDKETGTYIKDKGWTPGEVHRVVERGTKDDRKDYQRLLGTVRRLRKEGRHVAVVSVHLDRYGRDLAEQLRSEKEFRGIGVPVHFSRMGGTLDHDQVVMHGWMAEKEVQRTGERVSATKQLVAERGLPTSGPAGWGYYWRAPQTPLEERMSVGKTLRRVLDAEPHQAPAVAEAFRRAARGQSLAALNRWAVTLRPEALGVTLKGKPRRLGRSVLAGVLRNPLYVARYDRESNTDPREDPEAVLALPKGLWPALVTDDVWLAVQRRLAGHLGHPHGASEEYLLSGFAWCPCCAADGLDVRMVGSRAPYGGRNKSKVPVRRYRCVSYAQGTGRLDRRCNFVAPAALIEPAVRAEVATLVDTVCTTDPERLAQLERAWLALRTPKGAGAKKLEAVEQRIARLRQRIRRAREDLYDEQISRQEYEADTAVWRAELTAAERELAQLRAAPGAAPVVALPPFAEVVALAGGVKAAIEATDTPLLREGLDLLTEKVVPHREGRGRYRVAITWTALGEALRRLVGEARAA
jgi:DNA invertase Pin-like site-specific DNA recombinase